MRLDLNNDGKVTMSDLIEAVKNLRQIIAETNFTSRALEWKSSLYKKAIGYIEGEKQVPQNPKEEVPLAKVEEEQNSSDSVELQNFNEKDD